MLFFLYRLYDVSFVGWFGYVGFNQGSQCLMYRVVFSQIEHAISWFNSCEEWKMPVRRLLFSISDGRSCYCYIAFACPDLLARARRMSSFDNLEAITSTRTSM